MTALKKRITNPMTVIAIFATLSETSAAVSLPFLDEKEREIYIWFLITFPFYLLFLFFATLNFNYRSLYAPSDFEKGKHFIKVMDIAKRSGNAAPTKKWRSDQRPGCAQDPPAAPLSVQHYVRLPERLKDLYIIDTRWTSQKIELDCLIGKIHKEQGKSAHAIVFLTCAQTETMLKESTLKHSKHARKHSSAMCCIAYNLNSQGMTVIDQSLPTDTRQSVVIEDQPERNCQEGDNRN